MGGGGKKSWPTIEDVLTVAGVNSVTGTAGAVAARNDPGIQDTIDESGLNTSANKTKLEDAAKQAEAEQQGREDAIKENKSQEEYAKKNTAKRNRQRSLMGKSGGRSSTILTSGIDTNPVAGGKTLLGS